MRRPHTRADWEIAESEQEDHEVRLFPSRGEITAYGRYHELLPDDEVVLLYDSMLLRVPKKLIGVAEQEAELIQKLLGA